MRIRSIETILVDLPTVRAHRLANQTVTAQTLLIARVLTEDGFEGLGEATTIGGMSYGAEAPETIKLAIDLYIAPLLVGERVTSVGAAMATIDARVKGNALAKSAIETALTDLAAKQIGVTASTLLGGARTDRLEVAWTLATGDADRDADEAEAMLDARRHRIFKIKVGAGDPVADVARVARVKHRLGDRASVRVDVNQAWDELTARRSIAALQDAGIDLIEQPVARHDIDALARLTRRFAVPMMADEAVASPADAFALARARACDVFALKIAKAGGLAATARVAAIAEAAGIALYGGTMLEGTIGTLASAQIFATLPQPLAFGTELFGPLLLTDDIVAARPTYADFALILPNARGIGATIDEDKLNHYRRDRAQTRLSVATGVAA